MSIDDKALSESIKLTLEGNTDADIKEWLAGTYPEIKANKILKKIPEYLKDKAGEDKEIILGFCLEGARDLYRNLVKIGDFTGALKALQELAKLSRSTRQTAKQETAPEVDGKGKHELLRLVRNG
jgi:hypothetical protein